MAQIAKLVSINYSYSLYLANIYRTNQAFSCLCLFFFYIIDYCQPNPCLNNGVCVGEVDSFTCDCPNGFGGNTCSISKSKAYLLLWDFTDICKC